MNEHTLTHMRGGRIGMIFQEPMVSLNPLHRVGLQISEGIECHQLMSARQALTLTYDWLKRVGFDDVKRIADSYPHQLSGGQRQRVMIALALANQPDLLIADEPTTALDVTTQEQILECIAQQVRELNMAFLLITHDLGIVRRMSERILVMHQGKCVESNTTDKIFIHPQNAYTKRYLSLIHISEPTRPY